MTRGRCGSLLLHRMKLQSQHPAAFDRRTETIMKLRVAALLLVCAAMASLLWASDATPEPISVTGWVLDSACAITKGLNKPISRDCALACAKGGSQLVLLTDDGTIYWPISDKTPSSGQNDRLLRFAGGRVTAKGKGYVRGGSHAIVLQSIEAASESK